MTDFRAYTQSGEAGERKGEKPWLEGVSRSSKCAVGADPPKEADIKGDAILLLTFDILSLYFSLYSPFSLGINANSPSVRLCVFFITLAPPGQFLWP